MRQELNVKRAVAITAAMMITQSIGVGAVIVLAVALPDAGLKGTGFIALLGLMLISITGSLITVGLVRPLGLVGLRLRQTESSIEDLNRLNSTLRAQRHDFMNHLQVVYSLLELEEAAEAQRYIETVYTDLQKVSRILKTGIPAVNAILQAKMQMCEKRGITMTVDVSSRFTDAAIPDWELCRLLGNIIDNAIHALVESDRPGGKWLRVELFEDLKNHGFRIGNNGPGIPPTLWKRIFEEGFTTRVQGGEGMGLAICRRIISDCGGSLTVVSDEVKTVFEGLIPRKQETPSDNSASENDVS